MKNSHDKLTKCYSNHIINNTPYNKQEIEVHDKVLTGHYLKTNLPHLQSTNMWPPVHVVCSNVKTVQSRKPCLLYLPA